ncbi:uncharacterized protein ACA1_042260 [Acanthamoeba castellanii str. Neff]|uniref:Uncharacterized protein n=1 Tax=Acanthamoeba castellanii (strain ATCC 30010 / Neff) TaxID=1257118 RepID=L8GXR3_ACACF|nr:uncharacterized protein ACA1_042260 [Acanthamoeba castellanii str. Neff]ELR16876.1 hypothetical protein ACA1_042260 [Acanthamoeba castellanii str. Neff]
MQKDTPLMGFIEVPNGGECSVCLCGDKEMMQLPCAHVIDNEPDVGASKESAEIKECEEEDDEGEEEPDLVIHNEPFVVELESRVQGPGANIVIVGQIGSGKSRLVRELTGCSCVSWTRATATVDADWWTPYKTNPKSKITVWDSRGIKSWSTSGVEQLTESIAQLESASVGVDFVIITMKGARARLGRFLGFLNALGKNAAVAVMPSCGQGAGVGPSLMRQLAKMGAVQQLSPTVSQLTMANGGTICLLTSSSASGTSDGSVSSFGMPDLLMCILNTLPRHEEKRQNVHQGAGLRSQSSTQISAITLLVGWAGATVAVMKLLNAF